MSEPVLVESGVDRGLVWHYGDPLREQRYLDEGTGIVDLSNRYVVRVSGADWRALDRLSDPGEPSHLGSSMTFTDDDGYIVARMAWAEQEGQLWGWTEMGYGRALVARLRAADLGHGARVTVRPDVAVVWCDSALPGAAARWGAPDCLGGHELFVARPYLAKVLSVLSPAGLWAYTAWRIAAGIVRIGVDTDDRTRPEELVGHRLGHRDGSDVPPSQARKLVRYHLDGSEERFVQPGTRVTLAGTDIGFIGSSAYHFELGPIGLGLIAADIPDNAVVMIDGIPASVEIL